MHGLAFEFNTITFSTYYSEFEHSNTGHFNSSIKTATQAKSFCFAEPEDRLKTSEILDQLTQVYPQFMQSPRNFL